METEETLLLLYFLPRDKPLRQIKITLDWYSTAVLQGSLTDFYLFLGVSHSPTKTSDSVNEVLAFERHHPQTLTEGKWKWALNYLF